MDGSTIRVNGKACLVRYGELLEQMAVKGRIPLIGIGVELV
jgi:hypothetical protein